MMSAAGTYSVVVTDAAGCSFTLDVTVGEICNDNTVSITCDGGSFQSEVTWNLYDSNGGVVATGGAPFAGDLFTRRLLPDRDVRFMG